ncbi:hypothetical protein P7D22_00015 [Lichenihabitans sp. Uapishka_5]|uniref:hypothetical protein n=1 Tax=Lichenihabitans sp. Uapishka_5 TaxID=3037302 RepID=UPI0029E80AAD|nr:hypothetical protein [Lichenihabitans sp. Uapishka_5]MDX7949564.1 hypothetical protein [Lichenihabitans sp. Uapishka_5]
MADALFSDADLGITSTPAPGSLFVPPASTDTAPPLTVRAQARPMPVQQGAAPDKPQLFSDADLGIAPSGGAGGALANSPTDSNTSGFLKGAGTAVIKGLSDIPGIFGGAMDTADYLVARAQAKITGRPVADILKEQADLKEQSAADPVFKYADPRNWLPSGEQIAAPVLAKTGEYKPDSELGKAAMAAGEAAVSGFSPVIAGGGAGNIVRGGLELAVPNAAAGAASQVATDVMQDPLYGMAAGAAAGGAASAAGKVAARVLSPAVAGIPGATTAPILGPALQDARDQAAAQQLLKQSSDPAALRTWAATPDTPSAVPNSPSTTATAVGNDRGLFQAEKDARNANNLPFNAIDTARSDAQLGVIGNQQPTGDVFRPGRMFADRLDALDAATQQAEERLTAAHDAATATRAQAGQQAEDQANADLMARQSDRQAASTDALDRFGADQQAAHDHLTQSFAEAQSQAQQRAQDAAAPLGPVVPAEQAGATLRSAVEEARTAAKSARDGLYKAVDPDGTLATVVTPVKEAKQAIAKGIDPYSGVQPSGAEAGLWNDIDRLPDVIPFRSLQKLDTRVTAAMADARRNPNPNDPEALSRLTQLKGAVVDAIHDGVENQVAHEARLVNEGLLRPDQAMQARMGSLWNDDFGAERVDARASVARTGTGDAGISARGSSGYSGSVRAAGQTGRQSPQAPRDPGLSSEAPLYDPAGRPSRPVRPQNPQPQSLVDFIRERGGVQDPGGDLRSMGYGDIRGLIAKPGEGLHPDKMREAAAEAGYLGADTQHAVANTTINDLFEHVDPEHPVYSVRDEGASHAWDAYRQEKVIHDESRGQYGGSSAVPPKTPLSAYTEADMYPPGLAPEQRRQEGLRPNFDQGAADRLAAAKAAHATYAQTYRNGPVAPAIKTNGFAGQYVAPNGEVAAKAFATGPAGYERTRAFLTAARNDPRAVSSITDFALNPIRTKLTGLGTVSPSAFARWKTEYAGSLRAIDEVSPAFSSRFDNAASATQALTDAGLQHRAELRQFESEQAGRLLAARAAGRADTQTANRSDAATVRASISANRDALRTASAAEAAQLRSTIATQRAILADAGRTPAGRFGQTVGRSLAPTEVENTIGAMMSTGRTGASRMRSLATDAGSDPAALAGLRKAGVDYMVRSFSNADGSLSGAKFIKFVTDNRDTLKELFTQEQVSMFGAVARDAEAGARWRTETAIKGGSDTVKNLGALVDRASKEGKHFSFMSAAIGAGTAAFAHGGLKEAAYAGGAAGVAYLYNTLRSTGLGVARERYREALLDPQLAKLLISKMPATVEAGKLRSVAGYVRRGIILGPLLTGPNAIRARQ